MVTTRYAFLYNSSQHNVLLSNAVCAKLNTCCIAEPSGVRVFYTSQYRFLTQFFEQTTTMLEYMYSFCYGTHLKSFKSKMGLATFKTML